MAKTIESLLTRNGHFLGFSLFASWLAKSNLFFNNSHFCQNRYKSNAKPQPIRASFRESIWDSINDRILLIVAIFAVLSIIPGMVVEPKTGWVEGIFILIALFIQVVITAWNDYAKDSKFIEL